MIAGLIHLVIFVIIIGLVCWLLLWAIDAVGIPEPFHRVARVLIILVGCLAVILLLLQFAGGAGFNLP